MVAAKKKSELHASGRRKMAVARATLSPGKGVVRINSILLEKFGNELARARIKEPLVLAGDVAKTIDVNVKVQGGGIQGQADASRLAIGKVLAGFDKKLRNVFLAYDRQLLIADVRVKETRKPGDSKARAKRQKSYR